jgi:hypothetical protein
MTDVPNVEVVPPYKWPEQMIYELWSHITGGDGTTYAIAEALYLCESYFKARFVAEESEENIVMRKKLEIVGGALNQLKDLLDV